MSTLKVINRYFQFFRKMHFMLLSNGFKRADYLRKHKELASIGSNVYYYSRIFPSDAKLLKLGNNVVICTNVRFVCHDCVDILLNGLIDGKHPKYYAPIEIGNNVFIGSDSVILPGVKIEDNTIIGAGAVVTKDLPSGSVWGGVPARCIGDFNSFINNRLNNKSHAKDPEKLWEAFYLSRSNDK